MKALLLVVLLISFTSCSHDQAPGSTQDLGPSKLARMPNKDTKPKLTISNLKGERVVLLGNPSSGYMSEKKFIGGDPMWAGGEMRIHLEGKPNSGLLSAVYAGKSGLVVADTSEIKESLLSPGTYTIALDETGEKIETKSSEYLCPLSLLQRIKQEVEGKVVWAKGSFSLYQPGHAVIGSAHLGQQSVSVRPLDRLAISAVEPGVVGGQILVRLKKEDGQEGALYFGTDIGGGFTFDALFYPEKECGFGRTEWNVNRFFYFTDPVSLHPDWGSETRNQISKGEVTLGMNDEMVEASCGVRFNVLRFTAIVDDKGKPINEWVYGCCPNKDFVIENGKVTRYPTPI